MHLLTSLLVAALAWSQPAPPADREPVVYVRERLNMERIDQLVAGPARLLQSGEISGAQRLFERMLAEAAASHGPVSLEVADLMAAYAATLHMHSDRGDRIALQRQAGELLLGTAPLYRAVFGDRHPEVAVALTSYADVLRLLDPENPPREAEEAMAEAHRIRLAALGEYDRETLWTQIYLADIRGAPRWIDRDPRSVDQVAAELEATAAASLRSDARTRGELPFLAQMRRARVYARAGRGPETVRALQAAEAATEGGCLLVILEGSDVADLLESRGRSEEAAEIRTRYSDDRAAQCMQGLEQTPAPTILSGAGAVKERSRRS